MRNLKNHKLNYDKKMSLSIAILPLRLTESRQDLMGMLATRIDQPGMSSTLGLSSTDCREDLERISQLREDIGRRITSRDCYEDVLSDQNNFHSYYHYLLEMEEKGMTGGSDCISLEWKSALTGQLQSSHSIEGERADLIWNLSTVEAFLASQQALDSKMGWSKAAQHLQNAASWLKHLPSSLLDQHHHQNLTT